MYNFLLAFAICALIIMIGELVDRKTHAWVPSVFVSAVIFLVGYWTILPQTLVKDTLLFPFGATVAIFLLITHLGTIISLRRLIDQWKTVISCLAGLFGMCVLAYFVGPWFIDRSLIIAGLPPLTGGIIAATMMQKAAADAGLVAASVFAITMYCVQGFAGYPLTAIALKREAARLIDAYRKGEVTIDASELAAAQTVLSADPEPEKRLPLQLPEKWNTSTVVLGKLAIVAWGAMILGKYTGISGAIWALVLGVVFCTLGFLDRNALNKSNSFGICMFALVLYVFEGLKDCSPAMLGDLIGPMILLIILGVFGMAVMAYVASLILHRSFSITFANCLTALYGFPFDQIITISTIDSVAKNKEEHAFLMSKMFPSMIVGGFVTVTITSVFIAGIFAKMF
ncbi:MAG TPA: hypothetical protein DCW60_01090 [Sutterella sp.]|nr:hypothetical protein [Sutterella sp.]